MENESPARRVSLTKAQLKTALGAELLSICQSVTGDGRLSDQEINDLRDWLLQSKDADLPSVTLLSDVVGKALADGTITPEERAEIHRTLESVLPVELRRGAVAARREVEKQERAAQREERRAEYERTRPIDSANFMVAGCKFENRPRVIRDSVREGSTVYLRRDKVNRFSRHAIAVYVEDGRSIGFVPEDDAAGLAHILDRGGRAEAYVTKLLGREDRPIPVVQADFYNSDAPARSTDTPADPAPASEPTSAKGLVVLVIALLLIIAVAYLILRSSS